MSACRRGVPGKRHYWLVAASLGFGLVGLLWFLLGVPARALMHRESVRSPGVLAAGLLALPIPLGARSWRVGACCR